MRPHQWLKNLLIFLPPLLAHEANWQIWSLAIMAFTAFSLIASGVYLLNDMMDLSSDRAHPRKKERPFASGAVPLLHGMIMAPLLLLLGLFVGLATGSLNFLIILVIYVALTTGYSVYFKRKLVLDITMLASLYTIRIVAGALATGLTISVWLAAFSIFIFFSLAAIKRQTELVGNARAGKGKILGRAYSPDDLPIITMMAVAAGYVAVMVMALYINAQADQGLYQTPEYLWGICLLLLYWISRAVLLSHRGEMHDDPIVFAVRDRTSRITAITIASLMAAGTFL
jgi:4-hydroxybenzoate polyprenyltransferase